MVPYLTKWSVSHFGGWVVRYSQIAAVRIRRYTYSTYSSKSDSYQRLKGVRNTPDSKMSTYQHLMRYHVPWGVTGVQCWYWGTSTTTNSTITPKIMGTKGRVPQCSCSMIQLYICMYLYIGYMTHINVKRWNNNTHWRMQLLNYSCTYSESWLRWRMTNLS